MMVNKISFTLKELVNDRTEPNRTELGLITCLIPSHPPDHEVLIFCSIVQTNKRNEEMDKQMNKQMDK